MDIKNGLKQFIVDNGIIGTMAGVAIALYTKDLILSFSGDIVLPLMNKLLLKLNINALTAILPHKVKFNVVLFFQNLISWFLGVLITYLFIQFTVNYLFGITPTNKATATATDKTTDKDVPPKS
jgi:large-conductance mechanosensitive channel